MQLTIKEIGRKGGKATKKKYGPNHFSKLASLRWKKEKAKTKRRNSSTK